MAATRQRTKPGTKKLSEVARLVVAPKGITSTGWPAVRDVCTNKLGVGFDGWQDGAGRLILAKRADGKLASMIGGVGMSVPRQVGKTYLIAAITFALCILRPGMLVIWSAHHARTHGETFLSIQSFCKRSKVAPYILKVFTGSGDEEVRFRNGSRILFGARERGFGRGIPGVDMIVSDEAQIMSEKAVDAQLATMNTSAFGLAIYVGTPPRPDDPSEAFTRMRTDAHEGLLEDSVWIEIGADPDADPSDRKQWAKANPSWPHRTPTESILRLQRKLSASSFRREGLGIWDDEVGAPQWRLIPRVDWIGCGADVDPEFAGWLSGPLTVAIEQSANQAATHLVVAGECAEGGPGIDLHASGDARQIITHLKALVDSEGIDVARVVLDKRGPASSLVNDLTKAGIDVDEFDTAKLMRGTGAFILAASHHEFRHRHRSAFDDSVARSVLRKYGESRLIDRLGEGDPSIAVGGVLALAGHQQAPSAQTPGFAMILGGS